MKAVVIGRHGGPEVLQIEQRPEPRAGCGEAVVRVRACALNHLDLWIRRGIPGAQLPRVVGSDVAGVIESIGEGRTGLQPVEAWKPGDAVILSPGISCGACMACLAGRDNLCRSYSALGTVWDGGYAEKVKIPQSNLLPFPTGLSFVEAAAVPLTFLTAWHMLVTRAAVRVGETVLVLAAASGVGAAAIQVAKLLGARVFATTGSSAKAELARKLGAEQVFDHYQTDWHEQVRARHAGNGVDVVVEHPGAATFSRSVATLARGGRLVTCGATTGAEATIDLRLLFYKHLTFYGSMMGSKAELLELLPFVCAGQLRPLVDRTFPLEQARQAQQYLESSQHFGKVVLTVD